MASSGGLFLWMYNTVCISVGGGCKVVCVFVVMRWLVMERVVVWMVGVVMMVLCEYIILLILKYDRELIVVCFCYYI